MKKNQQNAFKGMAALALLGTLAACSTPMQVGLDHELATRCAEDGGVRVFATATRPSPKFLARPKGADTSAPYHLEYEQQSLRESAGTPVSGSYFLVRIAERMVRSSDGAVLGESVTYVRHGGDVLNPFHPTGKSCPQLGRGATLQDKVFGGSK